MIDDGYIDRYYWDNEGMEQMIETISLCDDKKDKEQLLREALNKYPHYYDFYTVLSDLLDDENIIELGYRYAQQRLKDENNGKLPKKMSWYFIENRHYFRIFYFHAENLIKKNQKSQASKILSLLMRLHPDDNIGARLLKKEIGY